MKKFCFLFFMIIFLLSCGSEQSQKTTDQQTVSEGLDTITTRVIPIEDGWGYEVLINNKVYVNQTIIPAISGKYAFGEYQDARKTAAFVVQQMMQNVIPPTVSVEELDSLGVLKNKINLIK